MVGPRFGRVRLFARGFGFLESGQQDQAVDVSVVGCCCRARRLNLPASPRIGGGADRYCCSAVKQPSFFCLREEEEGVGRSMSSLTCES